MNLFDVYSIFPINIIKGKGCYVFDDKNQSYLDFMEDMPSYPLDIHTPIWSNA